MTRRSHLKGIPDELIIPGSDGTRVTLMNTGVLECYCSKCRSGFWVTSNTVRCCPTCMNQEVRIAWTTPLVAFIPQQTPEEEG